MYHILTLITYVFDLFILYTFLNELLGKRKESIKLPVFIGCLIFVEILIFINECVTNGLSNNLSALITNIISLLTTFGLTFLYNTTMCHRIFISLSFQIFATLGEAFFTFIVQTINPSIFDLDKNKLIIIMNFGSKIILYIFVLICGLFWKKRISKFGTLPYNILLFSTPVISLVIILYNSLQAVVASENTSFFMLLYIALTLLNIINYILLERIFNTIELTIKCNTLEQQMQYQQDKYTQLGTAYKSNRSIIHDMKKHYFAISEYIKNQEYDKLQSYMDIAMDTLEANYASINTGNLVIDSFVSNFKNISESNGISFTENISVDANKIPVNDYDLCVILGNLLDNSFNSCTKITTPNKRIHLDILINDNDTFILHTKNSYANTESAPKTSFEYSLNHGYGLENIKNVVEANKGIFKYSKEEYFEVVIVIPIINATKQFHPVVTKNSKHN